MDIVIQIMAYAVKFLLAFQIVVSFYPSFLFLGETGLIMKNAAERETEPLLFPLRKIFSGFTNRHPITADIPLIILQVVLYSAFYCLPVI